MSNETTKAKAKLLKLSSSLDDLEKQIAPLLAQSLPETIVGLEPLQQAKLQTVIPYVVYDLIFIYLKTQGIDPKTHPLIKELGRVRQYFEKITKAESDIKLGVDAQMSSTSGTAPAYNLPTQAAVPSVDRTTKLDTAAAERFIKHAIAQSIFPATAVGASGATASTSEIVPVVVTSKMLERRSYQQKLKERGDENTSDDGDDSELEVIGGGDLPGTKSSTSSLPAASVPPPSSSSPSKLKGKGKASNAPEEFPNVRTKRRRPVIDPFGGYADDSDIVPHGAETIPNRATSPPAAVAKVASVEATPSASKRSRKQSTTKKSKSSDATSAIDVDASMDVEPTPAASKAKAQVKKAKKKTKKP